MEDKSSNSNTQIELSSHVSCRLKMSDVRRFWSWFFVTKLQQNCCGMQLKNISQKRSKIEFLLKKLRFFKVKIMIFFSKSIKWQICCRMPINWYCFLKMLFYCNCQVFWEKSEKKSNLEKIPNLMNKEYLLKKNAFTFLRDILNETSGRKICWW